VGSDVMSVEANSGNGYTGMSGTSMATPGAAGLGALMSQANPELSPFDMRNIMQETATYRECHYMFANEVCPEDLIPKNRQNNVYGHGHVNAQPAVMEAAQRVYELDMNIAVNVTTEMGSDNKIHINTGDEIDISLNKQVETIQWRSNHLRDNWAILHTYDGEFSATISHHDIMHQLEHLPNIDLQGNHSISIRALNGTVSSPLTTIDIYLMGEMKDPTTPESQSSSFSNITWIGVIIGVGGLLFLVGMLFGINNGKQEPRIP
jgi:hypothetical protein